MESAEKSETWKKTWKEFMRTKQWLEHLVCFYSADSWRAVCRTRKWWLDAPSVYRETLLSQAVREKGHSRWSDGGWLMVHMHRFHYALVLRILSGTLIFNPLLHKLYSSFPMLWRCLSSLIYSTGNIPQGSVAFWILDIILLDFYINVPCHKLSHSSVWIILI